MENIFERPILIWSEYCNYSKSFINALLKHNTIYNSFVRINIDTDPKTHKRPELFYQIQSALNFKINQVPTIIVNKGEYILSGVEAFKWLDYMVTNQSVVKDELQGFNPIEMGSFSDSYAKYGSTKLHDATEQSFKFLNKEDQKIETPQEEGVLSQDEMMKKQRERENISVNSNSQQQYQQTPKFTENFTNMKNQVDLSQYSNQRNNNNFMPRVSNSRIDFTSDSFGFAAESGRSGSSSGMSRGSRGEIKQQEIDLKLQQLIADRESTVPKANPRY